MESAPVDDAWTEQVRVRFLNNLGRDYYVQLSCPSTHKMEDSVPSAARVEANMAREREIFLKATLQLLDQQDSTHHRHRNPSHHSSHKSNSRDGGQHVPSSSHNTSSVCRQQDDNTRYDVIRLGFLRKARSGAFASTVNAHSGAWKMKYVELRHGLLTYDDHSGAASCSLEDLTSSDQSNLPTRRSIALSASDQTVCRECDPSIFGGCAFELLSLSAPRRVWLTNSVEECMQWVLAIRSAILGAALEDSLRGSLCLLQSLQGMGQESSFSFSEARSESQSFSFAAQDDSTTSQSREKEKDSTLPHTHSFVERESVSGATQHQAWLSIDGAAAPYARDMSSFIFLQGLFNAPQIDEVDYRGLLREMAQRGFAMSIPVLFIKSKTTHSNFVLSPQDSLSTQNVSAKCTSQVWKDLQRDLIVVNGDLISGERGAEAMVGALVRHICDKADEIKNAQDKQRQNRDLRADHFQNKTTNNKPFSSAIARSRLFSPSSHDARATNGQEESESKTPFAVAFCASEAQIVQCARDLLVLCNRTQSGGDTYFCVDALLCADKQRALSILTPFSPEAEPLHFTVDVVRIQQFQTHSAVSFSPSRRTGTSHSQREGEREAKAQREKDHHVAQLEVRSLLRDGDSGNFAVGLALDDDESGKYSPMLTQAQTLLREESRPKERENTRRPPTGSAAVDRDKDRDTQSQIHSVSSSLGQRRPQLDLITALERDGFLLGVAHRAKPLVLDDEGDSQEDTTAMPARPTSDGNYTQHLKEVQTLPLFSPGSSTNPPPTPMVRVPDQVIVADGKDDLSVISELTWDTHHRSATKLFPQSKSPAVLQGRHNQQSGIDDEAEGEGEKDREDEEDVDEIATDASSVSGKKKKSIFKKIGKKLQRPFRMEGLEAITSPLKLRRPRWDQTEETRPRKTSEPPCRTPMRESECTIATEQNEESNRSCIRVQVTANCKYRVCTANPNGIEAHDSWATVSGVFSQSFFIVGDGSGLLGIADRLVTIRVDEASSPL